MRRRLLLALCAAATSASAGTVYSQAPPNLNSFDITGQRLADDFSLSQAVTVTGIDFWYAANFQSDLTLVTYAIYQNAPGSLGSVLATGTASPATSDQVNYFFASFAIPALALGPGNYWLELHSGASLAPSGGLTVWWEAAADNATAVALSSSSGLPNTPVNVSGFRNYAFDLTGAAAGVPEPSAGVLIVAGLLCIGGARVRRSRSSGQDPTRS